MSRTPQERYVYARYQAAVWVEVALDEEVVSRVVVDDESMSHPVEFVMDDGSPASVEIRGTVRRILDTDTWPSWDYGSVPFSKREANR